MERTRALKKARIWLSNSQTGIIRYIGFQISSMSNSQPMVLKQKDHEARQLQIVDKAPCTNSHIENACVNNKSNEHV